MRTLKFVLIASLLMVMSTSVFAQKGGKGKGKGNVEQGQGQPQKSPEARAKTRTAWMVKHLSLSGQQETQVYDVLLTSFNKALDIKQTVKGPERKNLMDEIKTKREESIKAILTPQQYAQYQKLKEEKRQNGEDRDDDDDEQSEKGGGKNTYEPANQSSGGAVKGQSSTGQTKGKK